MNITHFHLLLNHFPIVGTLIAAAIMVYAIIKNNAKFKDLAAVLIVALAIITVIVNSTGEGAEDAVENLAGINQAAIEAHEDAAKPALILSIAAGLFCAIYLVQSIRKLPLRKTVFIVSAILTVLTFAAMARTGYYGRQIRHTELGGPQQGTTIVEPDND
jgi:uncharacterized membrane protein